MLDVVFANHDDSAIGAILALKLAKGEPVDRITYIPFELVTPVNMADCIGKN